MFLSKRVYSSSTSCSTGVMLDDRGRLRLRRSGFAVSRFWSMGAELLQDVPARGERFGAVETAAQSVWGEVTVLERF